MPVENAVVLPLRIVTPVWPPTRTPTLSSWGSGQVCGPIPGPVRVCPPRSTVMLSETMTMPSPAHVRSFARVKLSLTRIAQVPWRVGYVSVGDGAGVAEALAATELAVGVGDGPGVWAA